MEETKFEKVYSAVRILIKEQKMQSIKIAELEKKIDIAEKLSKRHEKALNDEKDQIDKRFDSVIERFENLDTIVEEQTETIDDIEKKSNDITDKLNSINESLKKINNEIEELEKKCKCELNEANVADVDATESDTERDETNIQEEIRQCRFDRVGYCNKGKDDCKFLHVVETCNFYLQNGYCNKVTCIKRHPKRCYFFERGFCKRNDDCRYLHRTGIQMKPCDNCGKISNLTYYCEFCGKSYCSHCTVEEAHDKDLHKLNLLTECKNIHI
jgi:hypothetical protein